MPFIGQTPTPIPLTSSDIADGIISNAKLAQDIISADTALGATPADTDEFLVSDAGTLKRMDYSYIKGGGNFIKLATSTTTSEGTNALDGFFSSTYDVYKIIGHGLLPSANADLKFTINVGGSAHTDSDYVYCQGAAYIDTSPTHQWSAGQKRGDWDNPEANVLISDSCSRLGSEKAGSLEITIYNPLSTSHWKQLDWHHAFHAATGAGADGIFEQSMGACSVKETSAMTGITFSYSTGNIAATFKLYGLTA